VKLTAKESELVGLQHHLETLSHEVCVALCDSVLQCVAVCCIMLHCIAVCCSVLQCVALCCSVKQCVAV